MNSEQLPAVSGDIHGKDYVRQAVHGFHVAVCRDPCHFCGWLRDCPGAKVYLVLVDFSGRELFLSIKSINDIQINGVASGGSAGFLPYVQL